jgi:hypothetical protein
MCDLLAPAVDALLGDLTGDARRQREYFANHGRYGDILRGWRGQAEVWRARLTREVIARRRLLATGQPLADLAKSEYFAELPDDPQTATGEATLVRTITNTSALATGNFPSGVIAQGSTLKRIGDASAAVPTQSAEYLTAASAVCGPDDDGPPLANGPNWLHTQSVTIAVDATRAGPQANIPNYLDGASPLVATIGSTLFDPTFTIGALAAAGGTLGVVDAQIAALALAMSTGSYGPTSGAAVAGVLTSPGARRAVYVQDSVNAVGRLFVADESWASSTRYLTALQQSLRVRPWVGWGCRVTVNPVANLGIVVAPSILLRSRDYVSAQIEITQNVKLALVQYFDERPDWYTWTLNALGGIVAGADARILACTAVAVRQVGGQPIAAVDEFGVVTGAQPDPSVQPSTAQVTHYSLVGQAVDAAYSVPG